MSRNSFRRRAVGRWAESRIEEVYFGKAKDVVGDLRSKYCYPTTSVIPELTTFRRHTTSDGVE